MSPRSAIYCEHANEVPYSCSCDAECYCKEHTCKRSPLVARMMQTAAEFDYHQAYGCTEYVTWKIQFAMIWAVIASMMPKPREPSRWTMLEIE